MAIDLDELVVLEDFTIGDDEESALDRLFPENFYVVGATGSYLTTMNNLDLYHRALELIGEDADADDPELREEIAVIVADADELDQEEYDEAVEREGGDVDEDFEDEEEDWDK